MSGVLEVLGNCIESISFRDGLTGSLFMAGLVGGFTHCSAMCGSFVVSQVQGVEKASQSMLVAYHLGRITTYILMAVVFATLLNLAFLYMPVRDFVVGPILMLAGALFLMSAFPKLAQSMPWLYKIQGFLPYKTVMKWSGDLSAQRSFLQRYALGVLLGFVPCGLIVAVVMAASTASSLFDVIVSVAAFGAGTMPALMGVGLMGYKIHQALPNISNGLRQFSLVISGIWLFAMAGYVMWFN